MSVAGVTSWNTAVCVVSYFHNTVCYKSSELHVLIKGVLYQLEIRLLMSV